MLGVIQSQYTATIVSDTSGTWGCGAFSTGEWFQLEWPESWRGYNITIKELLPTVLSVALCGGYGQNKTIRCRCDNAAVVSIVNTGISRFLAKHKLVLVTHHILSVDTRAEDALSRNDRTSFLMQVARMRREPTSIPAEQVEVLVLHPQD